MLTTSDREDFKGFCEQATNSQLINIIAKERDAGRDEEAQIAIWVAKARGMQVIET